MKATKVTAWIFTVLSIVGFTVFGFMPKEPSPGFDIIGILYILQNMIPLTILAAAFISGTIAVSLWAKVLQKSTEL